MTRILAVSCLRNEGPFVLEWVAHLRAAGVTDFLLFTNDCDDGTDAMLDALAPFGVVHLRQDPPPKGKSPQWTALKAAWEHPLRKACDWALVLDVDEFPDIRAGEGRFADLIAALPPGCAAITLPWRLFGHGGQVGFSDAPVTRSFTRAISPDCRFPVAATFFKTLFRLDGPFAKFGVHRPKTKARAKATLPLWADGSGQPLPETFAARDARLSLFGLSTGRDLVSLNHYSVKSAESFIVKRDRGLPNRRSKPIDLGYWVERNFNTVEAQDIARMRPATEAELTRMQAAAPELAALHAKAVAWHKARFADLITDEPTHRLFAQVLMAGSSLELPPPLQMQIIQSYQRIATQSAEG